MTDNSSQTVETVLGPILISELGQTLTHEHLAARFYKANKCYSDKNIKQNVVSLENIEFLDYFPYGNLSNISLVDDDAARKIYFEVSLFKRNRGKTIVDTSNNNVTKDLFILHLISKMTGINIIIGTGIHELKKRHARQWTEYLYDEISADLTCGRKLDPYTVESPIIKSAFIGEVGSYQYNEYSTFYTDLSEYEKLSIATVGEVQETLHCPVTFYPGKCPSAPAEIIRIYEEAGGDSKKAVMSHVDFAFSQKKKFMEFVDDTNCYLEFSMFGTPCSVFGNIDILSDSQRIKRIKQLKEEGKLNRILISHDIHTKNRLVSFGGLGFGHISKNIQPLMLRRGFKMSDIQIIMTENPKNWLSYNQTYIY